MGFDFKTDGDIVFEDENKASSNFTEEFKLSSSPDDWKQLQSRGGSLASVAKILAKTKSGGQVSAPVVTITENVDTGTTVVDSFDDTLARGVMWYWTIYDGTKAVMGQAVGSWDHVNNTISIEATRKSPTTGDTELTGLSFSAAITSNNVELSITVPSDNWKVTVYRQITGRLLPSEPMNRGLITEDTTIYVSSSGSDTTGDGGVSTPFYHPNAAFKYLRDFIISTKATVTVYMASGDYTYTEAITPIHPQDHCIKVRGAAVQTTSWTGIDSWTGVQDSYTATIEVASASIFSVDDYITVQMTDRALTRAEYCAGVFKVTAVDTGSSPNTITYNTTHHGAESPGIGSATCGVVTKYNTVVTTNSAGAISFRSLSSADIEKILFVSGTGTNNGIDNYYGVSLTGDHLAFFGYARSLSIYFGMSAHITNLCIGNSTSYSIINGTDGNTSVPGVTVGGSGSAALYCSGNAFIEASSTEVLTVLTGTNYYSVYSLGGGGIILHNSFVTGGAGYYGLLTQLGSFVDATGSVIQYNAWGITCYHLSQNILTSATVDNNTTGQITPAINTLGSNQAYNRS